MDLTSFSKAIAGGLVGLLVSLAARYGFHANADTISAVGVLVTGLVGYVVGHVVVYLAPANKAKYER